MKVTVFVLMVLTLLMTVTSIPLPAALDRKGAPYSYVVSSGRCEFKMSPDPAAPTDSSKGVGVAYRVGTDAGDADTVLWRTQGWYAYRVFLSGTRYLVRMGHLPRALEPEERHASPDHLAVAFYDRGQLLASYSTADLLTDPHSVMLTSSSYVWLAFKPEPQLIREESSGAVFFHLRTMEGKDWRFDIRSGAVVSE